jgi:hypothetical protein
MQGINRLKEAIERHKENKDPNLKYKTPLTGKLLPTTTNTLPFYRPLTAAQSATYKQRTTNKELTMPVTHFSVPDRYEYQNGFNSYKE